MQHLKKLSPILYHMPRYLYLSMQRFYLENTFSKAASLAYTTLLSLLPLVALIFGMLASFAVSARFVEEVRGVIFKQFLPSVAAVDTVIEYLTKVSTVTGSASFGATMLVSFLITAILLLNTIESSLNEIWQVFTPRTIGARIMTFCTMLLMVPVVIVSSVYFIKHRAVTSVLEQTGAASSFQTLVPFFTDCAAFFALFFFVPAVKVKKIPCLVGAFFSAFFFLMAKKGFAWYVETFASYDLLYGSISSIPIFLLWLYLAWVIVLFGAELAYQVQFHGSDGAHPVRSVVALGVCGYSVAKAILDIVTQRFVGGAPPITEAQLSHELKASAIVLRPILKILYKADIISLSTHGIVLLHDPKTIELREVAKLFGVNATGSLLSEEYK
jgi:membrane protein